MNKLATAALIVGYLVTICGGIGLAVKILGKLKVLTVKLHAISEGQQCQLRNDITSIYYRHNGEESPTLREYERKNLDELYAGYKALNGNSFIGDIYSAMREWRVIS